MPLRDDPPPAAPAVPEPAGAQLDEIIVTATKREKSAREIPLSISAVRGEDLEKQGARDVKDYLMQVPGISLDESEKGEAGGRRFAVRGVGPFTTEGNQAVGQFIGDVPLTDPVGNKFTPDLDPFDLQTVEVLKGPQGTAFGGTALNGAIRFVPNAPELDLWHARGFAEANTVDQGDKGSAYGVAANVPVGSRLALRASGVLQNTAGLYDNLQQDDEDADSRRKWSARGQGLWAVTDALKVNLLYLQQESRSDDVLFADNPERYENDGRPGPSSGETAFKLAVADVRYSFDEWGTLVWQGARQVKQATFDLEAPLVYRLAQEGLSTQRAYSVADITGDTQELRWVSSSEGKWHWVVGAFYMKYEALDVQQTLLSNTAGLGPLFDPLFDFADFYTPRGINFFGSDTTRVAEEQSFYAELSRELFDDFELTVGVRRYDTRLDAHIVNTGAAGPAVGLQNGNTGTDSRVLQDEKGYSPKVSLAWQPSRNLMVYASGSRGFQFGGTNAPSLFAFENPVQGTWPLEYKSSKLWNHELGVRTDWFDRTLRADITLYDIDWTDAQVAQRTSEGHILASNFTENVGKVQSRGVEGSLSWLTPLPGLSFVLNGAYNRAVTAEDLESNGAFFPAGTELPAAPKVQASGTAAYTAYLGSWVSNAAVSYSYWSKAYSSLAHQYEIYDFGILNLNLSSARPDWELAPALTLGVTNLLNEQGLVGRFGGGAQGAFGDANAMLLGTGWNFTRPRTISLRLTAEF